jgi:hypothetical protein
MRTLVSDPLELNPARAEAPLEPKRRHVHPEGKS